MYRKSYTPHYTDPGLFDQYYINQAGSGMPIYRGSTGQQRGYGLGGLLGGLFRSAIPLLKKGAAMAGKQALRTGADIAQDVLSGENIKTATKKRLKSAGRQMGSRVLTKLQTGRGKGVKKKKPTATHSRGRKKKKKKKKGGRKVSKIGIKRGSAGRSISLENSNRRKRSYNDIFD